MEFIPIVYTALAASVTVEILKLVPYLRATDERKLMIALIVSFVFANLYVFGSTEQVSFIPMVIAVLGATFAIYKAVVQPLERVAILVYRSVRESIAKK